MSYSATLMLNVYLPVLPPAAAVATTSHSPAMVNSPVPSYAPSPRGSQIEFVLAHVHERHHQRDVRLRIGDRRAGAIGYFHGEVALTPEAWLRRIYLQRHCEGRVFAALYFDDRWIRGARPSSLLRRRLFPRSVLTSRRQANACDEQQERPERHFPFRLHGYGCSPHSLARRSREECRTPRARTGWSCARC